MRRPSSASGGAHGPWRAPRRKWPEPTLTGGLSVLPSERGPRVLCMCLETVFPCTTSRLRVLVSRGQSPQNQDCGSGSADFGSRRLVQDTSMLDVRTDDVRFHGAVNGSPDRSVPTVRSARTLSHDSTTLRTPVSFCVLKKRNNYLFNEIEKAEKTG